MGLDEKTEMNRIEKKTMGSRLRLRKKVQHS